MEARCGLEASGRIFMCVQSRSEFRMRGTRPGANACPASTALKLIRSLHGDRVLRIVETCFAYCGAAQPHDRA
jgi:hypothetical protein